MVHPLTTLLLHPPPHLAPHRAQQLKDVYTGVKGKLTFKEKTEFETLGREIAELEAEKRAIENALSSGQTAPDELQSLSLRIGEVIKLLDDKEMRWLELSEV